MHAVTDKDSLLFPLFLYFLVTFVAIKLLVVYIDYRQYLRYRDKKPDPYLEGQFTAKEFTDSQAYNAEKMEFSIIHKLVDLVIDLVLWVLFFYAAIWNWMADIMSTLSLCADTPYMNDTIQALLFTSLMTLITQLINLPFSIYYTFNIEEKYGFNKTTPTTFVQD